MNHSAQHLILNKATSYLLSITKGHLLTFKGIFLPLMRVCELI